MGYWYIGLTDLGRGNIYLSRVSRQFYTLGKEGEWSWIHSGQDLDDEIWSSHKPNNKSRNSDDCVVMVLKNNQVSWEDHRYYDN